MRVTLNYHRCHGKHCEGKHPAKSFTSEPEERKKGWARCKCPIVASGSLSRLAKRIATKQTDWKEAAVVMAPFIAANSWELSSAPLPPTPPAAEPGLAQAGLVQEHTSIETATRTYITDHRRAQSAHNTIRTYGFLMEKIRRFSGRLGLTNIDEWTTPLALRFMDEWEVSPYTATKNLANMKSFFEYCVKRTWIEKNPARIKRLINNRASKTVERQRLPFSDEELQQMFDGCLEHGRTEKREWPKKKDGRQVESTTVYRDYHRVTTGEDLADFISVSIHTGLRISDVATFHLARLHGQDQIHVRTTKANVMLHTAVPMWLADRIRARAKKYGPLIFGEHTTTDLNAITDYWRKKLKRLWEQNGPWAAKPEPHRFRHTFARILLQKGTPVSVVAELMGNTEKIVIKHYAAWVPERQERVTRILREAFAATPKPTRKHAVALTLLGEWH